MLKNIWNWFVKSSENPAKVALTVKGILTGAVPLILVVTHTFGLSGALGDQEGLQSIIEVIGEIITWALGIPAILMAGYGLYRKLRNTISPTQ